jgi:hypothetical protein
MNLHRLDAPPPGWLGLALETFEQQFSYPLGEGASFHVVHGRQYVAFFQAMGEAVVFVAERAGEVCGTVAVIRRRLRTPEGEETPAYYVCDLKVTRARSGGLVLARLMHAVRDHVMQTGLAPLYGVVMDGTSRLPMQYTGRVGIPLFEPLAQIAVLRVSCEVKGWHLEACEHPTLDEIQRVSARLHLKGWSAPPGSMELRSEMKPIPLAMFHDQACGVVEDTRMGKRLVLSDGAEMKSAHLSCFGFSHMGAGLSVISKAHALARLQGFPALFLSVPKSRRGDVVVEVLKAGWEVQDATATVYGTGFPRLDSAEWWINTAEI